MTGGIRMLKKYKTVSIVYGGSGAAYARQLNTLITSHAARERYPLTSCIVLESILTHALLDSVKDIFHNCDFCVAILTADDVALVKEEKKRRLRQNVVFELGMALFQLGRERVILLSDFDPDAADVDLPSDIKELSVKQFTAENQEKVFRDVLDKILRMNSTDASKPASYAHLLERPIYYVDYPHILTGSHSIMHLEGNQYLQQLLQHWYDECRSFPHFEEKCLYFFERIGFLSIFGHHDWVLDWLERCRQLLSTYTEEDMLYCGRPKLELLRTLASVVIRYTGLKSNNTSSIGDADLYDLLGELNERSSELELISNPLVQTVFHDYHGLICMRLYRLTNELSWLDKTMEAFQRITGRGGLADLVDTGANIWTGFVRFNLARALLLRYERLHKESDAADALLAFSAAARIRHGWLRMPHLHATVRSALSYEYFICCIKQIEAKRLIAAGSTEQLLQDCTALQSELDTYKSTDEQLERLDHIQRLLNEEHNLLADA